MPKKESATETAMRSLRAGMTKAEELVMLELMLERSTADEIADAIILAKLSYEIDKIRINLAVS